jgi:O-antigen ligase
MSLSIRAVATVALLPLFLYPAAVSVSPPSRVTGKAALLLPALGLLVLWLRRRDWRNQFRREDAPALLALALLALSNLLTAWWFGQADPAGTQAARIGMALLLLPLARLAPISIDAWWLGCIAGAGGAALLSIQDVFLDHVGRAEGIYFHNIQGALGILLGLVPLIATPAGWEGGWRRALLWLGAGAGGVSIVLSESRMAWLAALGVIIWRFARGSRQRRVVLTVVALAALGLLLVAPVSERNTAWGDIVRYQHGDIATSLGMRFEMWRAAWLAVKAHPVFGIGPEALQAYLSAGSARGLWPAVLNQHTHVHNDLYHALTTTGIVGLIPLLLAFTLPWLSLRRLEKTGGLRQQAAARGGLALILSLFLLGLSETMFFHRFLFTWYYASLVLMLGWAGQGPEASATLATSKSQPNPP